VTTGLISAAFCILASRVKRHPRAILPPLGSKALRHLTDNGVTMLTMSESETLPCPDCGEGVEIVRGPIKYREDSSGLHSESTQSSKCPTCGSELVRDILPGAPWRKDTRSA
jgi:predicted RNA-binding Zn-ribbon protein involved in translation (DUF1610 family)